MSVNFVSVLLCVVDWGRGVTQLHDVVYTVGLLTSTVSRFSAARQEQLTDIRVIGLRVPTDIAACERMSQLYVADDPWPGTQSCIWRISSDGEDIQRWLPKSPSDTFRPVTLSVTSTRLLVTSLGSQLRQFDVDGAELRNISLPDLVEPRHAVESPAGTFIVSTTRPGRCEVIEVNDEGQLLHQFSDSLGAVPHLAIDSRGILFVADSRNNHILLLDAQLALCRVVIDMHQLNSELPLRLCYNEHSGQLLVVVSVGIVKVFDVLC